MVTRSEAYVAGLGLKTSLSMWGLTTPMRSKGKELCDFLIVCDPDVVIVSVKEIGLGLSVDARNSEERWLRKAVGESVKQVYGAERWLAKRAQFKVGNSGRVISLPDEKRRRVHRIAVALGGRGSIAVPSADFGKGFVHVFDEEASSAVLGHLDTIADLIHYLDAKEILYGSARATPLCQYE